MKNQILARGRFYFLLAAVIFFAVGSGLLYYRHNFKGLSLEALDCAQIARNVAAAHGFSTSVLQPQVTESFNELAKRDFVPELSHAPLYPVLLGAIFTVAGETDRVVGALSLALFVFSAGLLFTLVRRFNDNLWLAALCAVVFSISLPVLSTAISGQPQSLGCFLLLLLVLALTPAQPVVDSAIKEAASGTEKAALAPRKSARGYFVVGLLLALCYLNDYFSLCYTLPIVFLWRREAAPWKRPAVLACLFGFALLVAPWWIRNLRLTGNPFYSLQWNVWAAQVGSLRGVVSFFLQGVGRFFYDAATIPHLYLMPFLLVSLWLNSSSEFIKRRKSATLAAFVLAIFAFCVFGRATIDQFVPLAPLLTILGLTTFLQLAGNRSPYSNGEPVVVSPTVVAYSKLLKAMGLGISGQSLLERARYSAIEEQAAGEAYLYKGRWPIRVVRQTRALALLLPLLALPILFLPPRPLPDNTKAVLSPLAKVVPQKRTLVTDVPQQVAWYIDRKTMPLPSLITTIVDTPKTPAPSNLAGVYLSDLMGSANGAAAGDNWLRVYSQGLDLPGYQRVPLQQSRSLLYVKNPTIQEAQSLVKANPKSGDAYIALGNALVQKRQFRAALTAFTTAGQIQPRDAEAFSGAALASMALGDNASAVLQYNRAIAIAPRAPAVLLGLAQAVQASGKKDAAILLYERVLADSPDSVIALNNLAQLYADENKDLYRALEMARRAAAHNPGNPLILDTLASVCERLGYKEEAAKIRQQIPKKTP